MRCSVEKRIVGDALDVLRSGPVDSVAAVVTSPPYFALRRYGDDDRELGRAAAGVGEYVAGIVAVMLAIRDGAGHRDTQYWINVNDTANAYQNNRGPGGAASSRRHNDRATAHPGLVSPQHRNKSFLAVPQRLAVALVDAGFCLRSVIAWEAARLPETTQTRPMRRTETILFLTQHDRCATVRRDDVPAHLRSDVWRLPTAKGSDHPAAFDVAVPAACLAWLPPSTAGVVLDPFCGAGTTLRAATLAGRSSVGIDLYPWNG